MAAHLQTDSTPALAELVGSAVEDVQTLVDQQLQLFRVEAKKDLNQLKDAAAPMIVGGMIALVGALCLALGAGHLLCWIWPALPLWGGLSIVGGVFLLAGVVLAWLGNAKLEALNPQAPQNESLNLKENLPWKTKL